MPQFTIYDIILHKQLLRANGGTPMNIQTINIQNFRKLLQCRIDASEKTTIFVGANNSGKTSAMDALGKFLSDRKFTFNDITVSKRAYINKIGEKWVQEDCKEIFRAHP